MRRLACGWLALVGCGPRVVLGGEGDTTGGIEPTSLATSVSPDEDEGDEDAWDPDLHMQDPPDVPPPAVQQLDILVVMDNSATMGPTQEAVVRGLVGLVGQLEESELPVSVQMMFTTTDMGNPICEQFNKPDYVPAKGAPTTEGCNVRINRFTGLGNNPEIIEELCTDHCTFDVVPGDPFVAFASDGSDNIDGGTAADAIGCLAPQGIDGCGYEAPLEAMRFALDPAATWNVGDRPFMREDSQLVVVVVTDEADCSMDEFEVMFDDQYWNWNPNGGAPQASSAICWNAGVTCEGPDANGVYSSCATTEGPLSSLDRYANHFAWIREEYRTEVRMIAITGVPAVTEHSAAPPFEPLAGGVFDLVVRDWNEDDLLPSELKDGDTVEEMRWLYGVGPGCGGEDMTRAIPNHRVNEVCRALDDDGATRCCIESACDPIASLDCIIGWTAEAASLLPGG